MEQKSKKRKTAFTHTHTHTRNVKGTFLEGPIHRSKVQYIDMSSKKRRQRKEIGGIIHEIFRKIFPEQRNMSL